MLKRAFLSICTLFALLVPLVAHAYPERVKVDMEWRTRQISVNAQGWVDSMDINYSSAAQRADTTAGMFIGDAVLTPSIGTTSAVGDSLGWARVSFFPRSNRTTVAADSIYLGMQVSENGIDWVDVTPTRTFSAEGLLGFNTGQVVLEQGSSNTFVMPIRQAYAGTASGVFLPIVTTATTAPAATAVYGWQYIRFIVQADITGHYDGELQYFKDK